MNNLFLFTITNVGYYVICGVLAIVVLFGIYLMSKVEKAALGNQISALAMALGIIVTLIYHKIVPEWVLYASMLVGTLIGFVFAMRVSMLQMPQMIALFNGFGGAASALVGYFSLMGIGTEVNTFNTVTSIIAIIIGMITLLGSLVAAGKLHKVITQKPVILPMHQLLSGILLVALLALCVLGFFPSVLSPTIIMILALVLASLFGIVFCLRVGGADMPITISLLNSLSGVAGAVAGLAIGDILLVAIGGIVGASGLLLTQIMCKAMNRHLLDILLGKTTTMKKVEVEKVVKEEVVRHEIDPIAVLKNAKTAIIVPGYGMALAQAQHLVKELADKLRQNGTQVKFAIHPVAGRMPGHMNVLLAEVNVDYDDLYDLETINDEFANTDVTIVVGANDTLNPAAREAEGTPIYGMPILNVDQCKNIIIFNYDLKPGYAGVDNPIYQRQDVSLQLGNAAETLANILKQL